MADGNIAFNASLNTGGFRSGAAELQGIAGKMSSAVGAQFSALAVKVAAIGAAFIGVHQAANAFREALNMGGRLSDLSKTTGETAGNLAVLERAFDNAGVGADRVGPMFAKMSGFMDELGKGSDRASATANALGMSLSDLRGKTPTEQFQILLGALAGISDENQRAAISGDIFGDRLGHRLIPLAQDFAAEVSNARSELGSLPEILTKNADAMDNLGDKLENSVGNKLTEFAAGLAAGVQGANDLATALSRIDAAGMGQNLGEQLRNAFAAPLETAKAIGYTLLTGAKEAGNALINASLTAANIFQKTISAPEYAEGIGLRIKALLLEAVNAFNKMLAYGVDYIFLRPLSNLPGIIGDPFRAASATVQGIAATLEETSRSNYAMLQKGGEMIKGSFDQAKYTSEMLGKDWLGVEQSAADAARHIMSAQEKGSAKIAQDMSSARVDSERIAKALQDAKQNPFSPLFDKFGEGSKSKPFKLQPDLPGSENFPTSGGPGAANPAPIGGGGGARMAPPPPKTAQDYETEMRAAAAAARFSERASSLQERGFYQAAGQAMQRADRAAQDVRDRADISKFLREQYDAGNMGEAYEKYRRMTGMDRDSREEFEKRTREKALTDSERRAKDEERRGGGTGASPAANNPLSAAQITMASDIAEIKNVLVKSDGIHDRLPIRVMA
jgi:hypothetical protein